MTRAATRGVIDFSQFDPWDAWWWKKLRWVLDEVEAEQNREVTRTQHNHWITLASHSRLTEESFEQIKINANEALQRFLKLSYPWLADKMTESSSQTNLDRMVEQHHEVFGKPGEARYEKMIDRMYKVMTGPKRSQRQKQIDRKMMRLRHQEARDARLKELREEEAAKAQGV